MKTLINALIAWVKTNFFSKNENKFKIGYGNNVDGYCGVARGDYNSIASSAGYATIVGFRNSTENGAYTAIFGSENTNKDNQVFIVGNQNTTANGSHCAAIFGDVNDVNQTGSILIAGNYNKTIPNRGSHSSIVNGDQNTIGYGSSQNISGQHNKSAGFAVSVRGDNNTVNDPTSDWSGPSYSTVVGSNNKVEGYGSRNSLVNGHNNTVTGASACALVNGDENTVTDSAHSIISGRKNTAVKASHSTIEGYKNNITMPSESSSYKGLWDDATSQYIRGCAHVEGFQNSVSFDAGHAEGSFTTASGGSSHAEGYQTKASGSFSHAEGATTKASGFISHAEGDLTTASGTYSHAEGGSTTASGDQSHAEGYHTTASGGSSHAEGESTIASHNFSHAEGYHTTASSLYSHAEGYYTTTSGSSSHAEGYSTTASGDYSHAEGQGTTASGNWSHAEGASTIASGASSHVQGRNNISNTALAHIVGNGMSPSDRSNAHTLDWDGNAWYAGDVYVGSTSGTNKDAGSKKLATEDYVNTQVNTISATAERAETIAKGASTALVFNTKADMNAWLTNAENKGRLKVGDNLYIIDINTPDYWVSSVLTAADEESGAWYQINELESQKANLDNILTKNDFATAETAGVSKVNATYGIGHTAEHELTIVGATADEVVAGTSTTAPITPSTQALAAFYGLAQAAGVAQDQIEDANHPGQYSATAKTAILAMLGVSSIEGVVG